MYVYIYICMYVSAKLLREPKFLRERAERNSTQEPLKLLV
jgi:hypothetical protein